MKKSAWMWLFIITLIALIGTVSYTVLANDKEGAKDNSTEKDKEDKKSGGAPPSSKGE